MARKARWHLAQGIGAIAGALAALLGVAWGDEGAAPVRVRMTWKSRPAIEATLSWDTLAASEANGVYIRRAGEAAQTRVPTYRDGLYSGSSREATWHYHHARLTGLLPATTYEVQCDSQGTRSRWYRFETAPSDGRSVALLFGGDSRSSAPDRRRMNHLLARLVKEQQSAGRPPILALAHGGDYVADGRRLAQWREWLDDHEITSSESGWLLPVIPARGNHDVGPLFNEIFAFFPPDEANYHATTLGTSLQWLTLNTEEATAGDQQEWLDEQLAAASGKYLWICAQYHRPAFPAVKIPSSALVSWVPLFERYGVNLVCEADGHCIKRTPAILGTDFDPAGVVYIGEGGLGVGQRTPKTGRWYLQHPEARVGSGHHVHHLTFAPDGLTIRVILDSGAVFDEHVIPPRLRGEAAERVGAAEAAR